MNRIYKVVWSKAKNCYTVVSEIAKRHGKGNRTRTCAAAFLAAFALTGVMGMSEVQAADVTADNVNANWIQTNALNSKYNLTVGTANPNGSMPFLVNSSGAFYAANNKFSVDKDGKVIATAGKIGNVVLQNGVFTGRSALRDGELLVGDASGSYSQITTKGAKLGKVIVAEDGKITGVAAGTADTDAVNVGQLKNAVADAVKDAAKASDVGNIGDIHKELQNKDGSKTTVVDAVNNLDNKVGDLKYSAVTKGGYQRRRQLDNGDRQAKPETVWRSCCGRSTQQCFYYRCKYQDPRGNQCSGW